MIDMTVMPSNAGSAARREESSIRTLVTSGEITSEFHGKGCRGYGRILSCGQEGR